MKYPKPVQTGIDKVKELLAERKELRDVKQRAESDLQKLTGQLADVSLRFASEAAAAARSGGAKTTGPAHSEFKGVRDEEDRLKAAIAGLDALLDQNAEALLQADPDLAAPRNEFLLEKRPELDGKWQAVFESIRPELCQIIAQYAAWFDGGHLHKFEALEFPKLNYSREPFRIVPMKREDGRLVNALLDDDGCRKVYDEAVGLSRISESLRKECEAIHKSREARQDTEAAAKAGDVRHRTHYYGPKDKQAVLKRSEEGRTPAQIAHELGYSRDQVERWLQEESVAKV